jgi:hypothetical protein
VYVRQGDRSLKFFPVRIGSEKRRHKLFFLFSKKGFCFLGWFLCLGCVLGFVCFGFDVVFVLVGWVLLLVVGVYI